MFNNNSNNNNVFYSSRFECFLSLIAKRFTQQWSCQIKVTFFWTLFCCCWLKFMNIYETFYEFVKCDFREKYFDIPLWELWELEWGWISFSKWQNDLNINIYAFASTYATGVSFKRDDLTYLLILHKKLTCYGYVATLL